EIKPALLTYQTTLEIEYIKESLKDLEIKPDNAINELEKLGMQKDIAQLIVNTYIPTFYNVHTIIQNVNLTGKELFLKTFTLEYEYAVQRIVRQFLRSLLSRALSNFGRPYLDFKYLDDTIAKLFKDLGYPEEVRTVFDTMITQSQLIYTNQL
ncbi:hypothetical protein ACFFQV_17990, partial [Agromyces lapidis]